MTASAPTFTKLGVDVGGTFLDFVLLVDGQLTYWKQSRTEDVGAQIRESVRANAGDLAEVDRFVHGTTIGINALLEERWKMPCLITTEGFVDLPDLRRQRRPDLYRSWLGPPSALVDKTLRWGVRERVAADGTVLLELAEHEAQRVAASIPEEADAVAICFLHAYANPSNEKRMEAMLREERPDLTSILSSTAFPEIREYERMMSVIVEAYLQPEMRRYLERLERAIGRWYGRNRSWLMQSNGGILPFSEASKKCTNSIMSGPAGGVMAAQMYGNTIGDENLITMDVGGTSADVCLIVEGMPRMAHERIIRDMPLITTTIDVQSIGAGGGSIVALEEGGLLKVGPRSAGSEPGPAAYGGTGREPTLTDAHVILGRLPVHQPLGGIHLHMERAREAFSNLARMLQCSVEEVAEAAIDIANASMVNAIRLITVERGYDPRDYVLVAYGGMGPLHAAEVAAALGIGIVLIPPAPGVFSAIGTVATRQRVDVSRSVLAGESDFKRVLSARDELIEQLDATMSQVGASSYALAAFVDTRYRGQNWALTTPLGAQTRSSRRSRDEFERLYEQEYGHAMQREVEFVTVRVSASEDTKAEGDLFRDIRGGPVDTQQHPHRIRTGSEWTKAWRTDGIRGEKIGPGLVALRDSTIFVPEKVAIGPRAGGGYKLRVLR